MRKGLIFGLILLFTCILSGCQVFAGIQPTSIPAQTEAPMLMLEQVPEMPTLPVMTPTPTLSVNDSISYSKAESHFTDNMPESLPQGSHQSVIIRGHISESDGNGKFSLRHANGTQFKVNCDDYCFYTDAVKQVISAGDAGNGKEVIVYGASSEDPGEINADLIMVNMIRSRSGKSTPADMSGLTNLTYTEFELAGIPQLQPLSVEAAPTKEPTPDPYAVKKKSDKDDMTLNERLADRLHHNLERRNYYAKGYYGEIYTVETAYDTPENRAPEYPTRSNMIVQSGGYDFFDFWFPYEESPLSVFGGILTFGGDWYLSIRLSVDINPDPKVCELVYTDRTIVSQYNFDKRNDYLRSFGFSIINSTLFYFYEKENGYGISLNRNDYDLGFDEIPYGYKGQFQSLEPFYADDLITFFGHRDGKWYYVELAEPENLYGYY